MSTKLTHEEFMRRFKEKNNHDITILGEYNGLKTPIRVRCNTHNIEYNAIPAVLLRGSGCEECGKEKISSLRLVTHDDFMIRLMTKNEHVNSGNIKILGRYEHFYSRIECKCMHCGHKWQTLAYSLWNGSGCPECFRKNFTPVMKLTNDDFLFKLSGLNNDIVALDEYDGINEHIRFRGECGHIWSATPRSVLNGTGCPYCTNRKILVGFNDIWTTRPDVAEMLKDPNDGYKYTCYSNKKVEFVCPLCGYGEEKIIANISKRGLCCQCCSDGISYPNKFSRAFLGQLDVVSHKCEYSPKWAKPYKYDNYFEYNDQKYILEMDGPFHYKDNTLSKQTFEEAQAIDVIKTTLANEHGIRVIRIDCIQSDCEYIKNNILSSELNDIFDLSNINWKMCDEKAQKSLVKEACNLYVNETCEIDKIASKLHLSKKTIRKYLRNGKKFGWCNYDT